MDFVNGDHATFPLTNSVCFRLFADDLYKIHRVELPVWIANIATWTKNQRCLNFHPHCSGSTLLVVSMARAPLTFLLLFQKQYENRALDALP